MENSLKYSCFSNLNKRRILTLLRFYPLTITDCTKVLGMSKQFVNKYLKEFTEAGIASRDKIHGRNVIYHTQSPLTENPDSDLIASAYDLFEFDERPHFEDIRKYHQLLDQGEIAGLIEWNRYLHNLDKDLIKWYRHIRKNMKHQTKVIQLKKRPVTSDLEEMAYNYPIFK